MTVINKSALVTHSPEQMFRLVDNINDYPEYLPWCVNSEELQRKGDSVEARIDISHSGFKKSFSTRNKLTSFATIEMELLEGPFKYLIGTWSFEALGDENNPQGCKISLHLEFEFTSKLIGMTFGKVFGKIASSMVDSFTERASKVYA
ncbi:MAG: type II toxin-antitoxin system RatA family toxin [Gammaproteobacteria bacterium]